MDKKQAQALIKETFGTAFDKGRFTNFIINLLNLKAEQIEHKHPYSGNFIPDSYEQYISTLERITKYTDGEHKIDILIAKLKKETSIERARTMQRNFVAWYLNGSRGGEMKDAALVAFVAPNEEDWRFSLVKMDYRYNENRNKVVEEFTPARRWSFLVGVNENSHTAQSQLVDLVADDERNPVLNQIEEAFNIEKVTKEFFEKYRELFLWTNETLDDTVKKDKKIREDFETKGVDTVDFSKKLLGQIVFLYFLQKKGWFGVKRDAEWGTGPKNFLRELFEGKHGTYKNFFNDILEPLFYEALARERDDDFYSRFNCKIPFLNGGLFDPINNYDWVHTDILLPDDLFSNNYKTKEGDKGNGILDIFDRYNFTVKEDEPLEKEVAVDPEMLGKVFENLLEVKDRRSKGTYYTPREIVHYMCQQSLVSYLATELEGKVSKEDIEMLVKYGEHLGENESTVEAKGRETSTYFYKLPETVRQNAEIIDEKLINIKVCDPAIGSGAFPIGMMTEIVRTRNTLSSYIKDSGRSLYNFKRDCIHNSLYGVDIDPSAVEIAKLRLWLSLVVDEDDMHQIKPLPNLDYKIMQGNSLLEEYEGIQLFDDKLISTVDFGKEKQISDLKEKQAKLSSEYIRLHQADKLTRDKKQQIDEELKKINAQIKRLEQSGKRVVENASLFEIYSTAKKKSDELKRLQKEFFETTQKTKKDELKKQIERLEWDLIETTLREQNKTSELRKLEALKKANVKPFFLWKLHFPDVFQENGGFDVVLGNPPYISAVEHSKTEDKTRDIYRIKYPLVKGAFDIYAIFLLRGVYLSAMRGNYSWIIPNKFLVSSYAENALEFLKQNGLNIVIDVSKYHVFDNAGVYPIILLGNKITESFNEYEITSLSDLENNRLVKRIKLKEVETFKNHQIKIGSGTTGFQAHQIIPYISDKSGEDSIPFIVSGSIDRYYIDFSNVRYMGHVYRKAFIKKGAKIAESKWDFWRKEKIVIAGMTKQIEATYCTSPLALGVGVYAIYDYGNFNPKFLLALLNSRYLSYYLNLKFKDKHLAGGYLAINKSTIEKLPLLDAPFDKQKEFAVYVDKILATTKVDDYLHNSDKQAKVKEYEHQIDQLVYQLYGLTREEIKIVEGGQ